MRQRTSRIATVAAGLAAAAALAGGPGAQGPRHADAEYLRTAYSTYRSMARSSPYTGVPWQCLGPDEHQSARDDEPGSAVVDRLATSRGCSHGAPLPVECGRARSPRRYAGHRTID